uniref:Uncharacterized protein n=1 Tax=Desertifilum tharense IPPAS B-1220 TaxID=1781255 RepID=A0ACD5H0N0_9CYAN
MAAGAKAVALDLVFDLPSSYTRRRSRFASYSTKVSRQGGDRRFV